MYGWARYWGMAYFVDVPTQGADKRQVIRSHVTVQMNINLETAETAHLLGLNGIPIERCFVSQQAYRCIDMTRISIADARLQFQVHVFEASGIFLAEHLSIDRRLPVHAL